MLLLNLNGAHVPFSTGRFPAGETNLRLDHDLLNQPAHEGYANITFDYESNSELFDLALLVDAVRRHWPLLKIRLNMAYLPYARQDRVCNKGEAHSLRVLADFINSLKFNSVTCYDLHSEVSVALLNNLYHYDLIQCTQYLKAALGIESVVLVSPDAGANKKVLNLAMQHDFPRVARADKKRDVATGEITGTVFYPDEQHSVNDNYLIVDDICDGGRTFIELAKVLRRHSSGKIYLYVTHGIFSKGLDVFDGLIDGIFVCNLMKPEHYGHHLLKEI